MEKQNIKSTLITGACSGIGLELTRCFARDGHHVIMVAHFEGNWRTCRNKPVAAEAPWLRLN